MEPPHRSAEVHPKDNVFIWDKEFCVRRAQAYQTEDRTVLPAPNQSRIDAFLEARKPRLQPSQCTHTALRLFLSRINHPDQDGTFAADDDAGEIVLLDDRRDDTVGEHSWRNWEGYRRHPPEGRDIWAKSLSSMGLYERLSKEVHRCACVSRYRMH